MGGVGSHWWHMARLKSSRKIECFKRFNELTDGDMWMLSTQQYSESVYRVKSCTIIYLAGNFLFTSSDTSARRQRLQSQSQFFNPGIRDWHFQHPRSATHPLVNYRPVTSVGSRQRLRSATRGDLVVSSSAMHFGSHAFAVAGPKGWNQLPAHLRAGIRDSCSLQDGIKDLSSLHPVTVTNCQPRRALVMTLFMLRRVRNCRRYYYYYYYYTVLVLLTAITYRNQALLTVFNYPVSSQMPMTSFKQTKTI